MRHLRLPWRAGLWAMLAPGPYPDARFYGGWRDAVLYDEHTWGAHCSITQPDSQFTKALEQAESWIEARIPGGDDA